MTNSARKINQKPAVSSRTQANTEQATAHNNRVLIVEDEPGIAEAYRDILAPRPKSNVIPFPRSSRLMNKGEVKPNPASSTGNESFELTIVHNAEQALAEVKAGMSQGRPFTMGFFDVLLGEGMDGIELVKRIHEIDSKLYAVFVTAYSDRGVDSIQSLLGEEKDASWDYLNKPFSQGEILQKARNGVSMWNLRHDREEQETRLSTLQKQLLENERFSTVATVARGIGHEFRNIMTQIMGRAELSRNVSSVDQLQEAITAILSSSRKATEILERFKFLHNPHEQVQQKRFLFIHQPIEEALSLMGHQLRTQNVQVCWPRRKSVLIYASGTPLMQVFVNLIINSLQAMGGSGQIDISIVDMGNKAEIRFRDYGPGVDPALLERLTEPFFTTKGDAGSGLGLAIVKEIIETENNGTLQLVNHPIKGLEVVITLPVQEEPSKTGVKQSG